MDSLMNALILGIRASQVLGGPKKAIGGFDTIDFHSLLLEYRLRIAKPRTWEVSIHVLHSMRHAIRAWAKFL